MPLRELVLAHLHGEEQDGLLGSPGDAVKDIGEEGRFKVTGPRQYEDHFLAHKAHSVFVNEVVAREEHVTRPVGIQGPHLGKSLLRRIELGED